MKSKSNAKPSRLHRIVANIGTVLAALWLLAYLLPAGRDTMMDALFAFLLGLLVTGVLWWTARRSKRARRFWGLLAAGWSVALVGNIAWGLYEVVTGQSLPYISLVDALYLARYVLLFVAFWRCWGVPRHGQWFSFAVLVLAAAAVAAGLYVLTPPDTRMEATLYFAGAVYPILDVGLVYLALEAWWHEPAGLVRTTFGLLTLALIAYATANWLNSYGRLVSFEAVSSLAGLFWPLSDIFTGLAVFQLPWMAPSVKAEEIPPGPA